MKVTVHRVSFLEALAATAPIASARTPKPVLQCVKITAEGNKLTVSATDLEVALRYSTGQVQIDAAGEVLVPADRLTDIVKASSDDTLVLSLAGEQLNVLGSDSHFKIYTQSIAEFPPVPAGGDEPDFEVKAGVLLRLIGQTTFAAAKEATRYTFNGVLTTVEAQRLILVATDGRRLALAKGDTLASKNFDKQGAIVPARSYALIEKLLNDPEATVGVKVNDSNIVFSTEDAVLTSNLLEGTFPPYGDVIPKECDRRLTAGRQDLLSAVRRAGLVTTKETKCVRMSFDKTGLTIVAKNPDTGEAVIKYPAKLEGASIDIGFNPVLFQDGLKAATEDEVVVELLAPNRPGLITSGPDFSYVIMPVNLQ